MKRSVIGIDVGKYELAVYWNNEHQTVINEPAKLKNWLVKNMKELQLVDLIVFEPTGGYERELKECLEALQLPYCQVHANHVRSYAKASGIEAKTDHIDAKVLAEYAVRMGVQPRSSVCKNKALKSLLVVRKQLIAHRLQEKNRLDTCDKFSTKWIKRHIKYLDKEIALVEKAIDVEIKKDEEVKKLFELYSSVPGIGKVTAAQLIVDLPELQTENDKTIASLVGVAPFNRDSGRMSGRRRTRGGRTQLRGLLYMAALVAARCNPQFKAFYTKLRCKGKAAKVALIAVAHKLLMVLRSIAQRQTPWVPAIENN